MYEDLDNTQEQVEQLQEKLRRFKTELADVTIKAELQVSVDGFLRFADFFFDGLLTDLAVMEHINDSQEKIRSTQKEIQGVLDRLTAMWEETSANLDRESANGRIGSRWTPRSDGRDCVKTDYPAV